MPSHSWAESVASSEFVGLARHARRAPAGQWFVFVNDVGESWDSGYVLMGWN